MQLSTCFFTHKALSQSSRVFRSDASLTVTSALVSVPFRCVSGVLLFPFSTPSFCSPLSRSFFSGNFRLFIPLYFCVSRYPVEVFLRSSICRVIVCIICSLEHLLGSSRARSAAWFSVKIRISDTWFCIASPECLTALPCILYYLCAFPKLFNKLELSLNHARGAYFLIDSAPICVG